MDVPGDIDVVQLAELPLLLTIRQAAKVLDVCPAKAYAMAHRYEVTGCEGLPVIRLDKLYRVPRWPFAVLVLTGRVVTLAELEAHAQQVLGQLSDQRAREPGPGRVEPDAASRSRSPGTAGCRSWPPLVRWSSSLRFGRAAPAAAGGLRSVVFTDRRRPSDRVLQTGARRRAPTQVIPVGVWTGSELVVWGGWGSPIAAAYDPVTDRWRDLPPDRS